LRVFAAIQSKRLSMNHLHEEASFPGQAQSSLVKPNYVPSASPERLGFATFARFMALQLVSPTRHAIAWRRRIVAIQSKRPSMNHLRAQSSFSNQAQSRPIKANQGIFYVIRGSIPLVAALRCCVFCDLSCSFAAIKGLVLRLLRVFVAIQSKRPSMNHLRAKSSFSKQGQSR